MDKKLIYYLYKTTCILDEMIYIGVHSSRDFAKSKYLGSGKRYKNAEKKYGKHNFTREILYTFDNKYCAYIAEEMIVDIDFIKRLDTYNIKLGGRGGWDYCNNDESRLKSDRTKTERYGSIMGHLHTPEIYAERVEKYGSPMGQCHTKEVIEKRKATQKLLGNDKMLQCKTPEALARRREVLFEKGLNIPTQCNTPEAREKVRLKNIEKYGTSNGQLNTPEALAKRVDNNYRKRIEKYPFLSLNIIIKSEEGKTLFSDTIHNISRELCPRKVPGFGERINNHLINKTLFHYKDFKNCIISLSEN